MEWKIWITWWIWIIFCDKYSRLFWVYYQKHEKVADNPSIRIYVHEMENRIKFKIKKKYLKLLSSETIKLLGRTNCKITKDKNGKNVPYLEITESVFVYCNVVNNDYQLDSRVFYTFFPNMSFGQLLDLIYKFYSFKSF